MRNMTVEFPDRLLIEQLDDVWVMGIADFRIVVKEEGQPDYVITVPAGRKSDYASVPKIPGPYELYGGKGKKPAYGHDYTYSPEFDPNKSRKWCDAVFHHGLIAIGMSQEDADAMYAGVRVGGESHWKN